VDNIEDAERSLDEAFKCAEGSQMAYVFALIGIGQAILAVGLGICKALNGIEHAIFRKG
jgi:hypothetical protein